MATYHNKNNNVKFNYEQRDLSDVEFRYRGADRYSQVSPGELGMSGQGATIADASRNGKSHKVAWTLAIILSAIVALLLAYTFLVPNNAIANGPLAGLLGNNTNTGVVSETETVHVKFFNSNTSAVNSSVTYNSQAIDSDGMDIAKGAMVTLTSNINDGFEADGWYNVQSRNVGQRLSASDTTAASTTLQVNEDTTLTYIAKPTATTTQDINVFNMLNNEVAAAPVLTDALGNNIPLARQSASSQAYSLVSDDLLESTYTLTAGSKTYSGLTLSQLHCFSVSNYQVTFNAAGTSLGIGEANSQLVTLNTTDGLGTLALPSVASTSNTRFSGWDMMSGSTKVRLISATTTTFTFNTSTQCTLYAGEITNEAIEEPPTPTGLVYSGKKQFPFEDYIARVKKRVDVTGAHCATDPGEYTVNFALIYPEDEWENGGRETKSITWSIAKYNITITHSTGDEKSGVFNGSNHSPQYNSKTDTSTYIFTELVGTAKSCVFTLETEGITAGQYVTKTGQGYPLLQISTAKFYSDDEQTTEVENAGDLYSWDVTKFDITYTINKADAVFHGKTDEVKYSGEVQNLTGFRTDNPVTIDGITSGITMTPGATTEAKATGTNASDNIYPTTYTGLRQATVMYNGTIITSSIDPVGDISTGLTIKPVDITDSANNFTYTLNELTYTSEEQTMHLSSCSCSYSTQDMSNLETIKNVELNLTENTDYVLSNNTAKDVKSGEKYKLTITCNGNFSGSKDIDWNISPAKLTVNPTYAKDFDTTAATVFARNKEDISPTEEGFEPVNASISGLVGSDASGAVGLKLMTGAKVNPQVNVGDYTYNKEGDTGITVVDGFAFSDGITPTNYTNPADSDLSGAKFTINQLSTNPDKVEIKYLDGETSVTYDGKAHVIKTTGLAVTNSSGNVVTIPQSNKYYKVDCEEQTEATEGDYEFSIKIQDKTNLTTEIESKIYTWKINKRDFDLKRSEPGTKQWDGEIYSETTQDNDKYTFTGIAEGQTATAIVNSTQSDVDTYKEDTGGVTITPTIKDGKKDVTVNYNYKKADPANYIQVSITQSELIFVGDNKEYKYANKEFTVDKYVAKLNGKEVEESETGFEFENFTHTVTAKDANSTPYTQEINLDNLQILYKGVLVAKSNFSAITPQNGTLTIDPRPLFEESVSTTDIKFVKIAEESGDNPVYTGADITRTTTAKCTITDTTIQEEPIEIELSAAGDKPDYSLVGDVTKINVNKLSNYKITFTASNNFTGTKDLEWNIDPAKLSLELADNIVKQFDYETIKRCVSNTSAIGTEEYPAGGTINGLLGQDIAEGKTVYVNIASESDNASEYKFGDTSGKSIVFAEDEFTFEGIYAENYLIPSKSTVRENDKMTINKRDISGTTGGTFTVSLTEADKNITYDATAHKVTTEKVHLGKVDDSGQGGKEIDVLLKKGEQTNYVVDCDEQIESSTEAESLIDHTYGIHADDAVNPNFTGTITGQKWNIKKREMSVDVEQSQVFNAANFTYHLEHKAYADNPQNEDHITITNLVQGQSITQDYTTTDLIVGNYSNADNKITIGEPSITSGTPAVAVCQYNYTITYTIVLHITTLNVTYSTKEVSTVYDRGVQDFTQEAMAEAGQESAYFTIETLPSNMSYKGIQLSHTGETDAGSYDINVDLDNRVFQIGGTGDNLKDNINLTAKETQGQYKINQRPLNDEVAESPTYTKTWISVLKEYDYNGAQINVEYKVYTTWKDHTGTVQETVEMTEADEFDVAGNAKKHVNVDDQGNPIPWTLELTAKKNYVTGHKITADWKINQVLLTVNLKDENVAFNDWKVQTRTASSKSTDPDSIITGFLDTGEDAVVTQDFTTNDCFEKEYKYDSNPHKSSLNTDGYNFAGEDVKGTDYIPYTDAKAKNAITASMKIVGKPTLQFDAENNLTQIYDGQSHTIKKITLNKATTLPDAYEYQYAYNSKPEGVTGTNAGDYTLDIGEANVTITVSKKDTRESINKYVTIVRNNGSMIISPRSIAEANIQLNNIVYSGIAQTVDYSKIKSITVKVSDDITLTLGEDDYAISGDINEIDVKTEGNYNLTITAKEKSESSPGNYTGTKDKEWNITPAGLTIEAAKKYKTYDCDPFAFDANTSTAKIEGLVNEHTLTATYTTDGADVGEYNINNTESKKIVESKLAIKDSKGNPIKSTNYAITRGVIMEITQREIKDASFTLDDSVITPYSAQEQTVAVNDVMDESFASPKEISSTDFTAINITEKNAGTYKVQLNGKNNYKGSSTLIKSWSIAKAPLSISSEWTRNNNEGKEKRASIFSVKLTLDKDKNTGEPIKPEGTDYGYVATTEGVIEGVKDTLVEGDSVVAEFSTTMSGNGDYVADGTTPIGQKITCNLNFEGNIDKNNYVELNDVTYDVKLHITGVDIPSVTVPSSTFDYDGVAHNVEGGVIIGKGGYDDVQIRNSQGKDITNELAPARVNKTDAGTYTVGLQTYTSEDLQFFAKKSGETEYQKTDGALFEGTLTINARDLKDAQCTLLNGFDNLTYSAQTYVLSGNVKLSFPESGETQAVDVPSSDFKLDESTQSQTNAGDFETLASAAATSKNFKGQYTVAWSIKQKNIADDDANVRLNNLKDTTYAAKEVAADFTSVAATLKGGEKELALTTDYTIEGNTGVDAKTYQLTLYGAGNYTGKKDFNWKIVPASLKISGSMTKEFDTQPLIVDIANPPEQTHYVVGLAGDDKLSGTLKTDDIIAATYTCDSGAEHKITPELKITRDGAPVSLSNYSIQYSLKYVITQKSITLIANSMKCVYNGEERTLSGFTVKEFVGSKDYKITGVEDTPVALINVGTVEHIVKNTDATIVEYKGQDITGSCKFLDPVKGTLEISALNITQDNCTIKLRDSLIYDGTTQKQTISSVTVKDGEEKDVACDASQYDVVSDSGKDAKEYTLTITAKEFSNFTGSCSKKWTISSRDISNTELGAIEYKLNSLTYTSEPQTETFLSVAYKVKDREGTIPFETYVLADNIQTNAGDNYEMTVNASGNFTGATKVTWSIAKAKMSIMANHGIVYDSTSEVKCTITADSTVASEEYSFENKQKNDNFKLTYSSTGTSKGEYLLDNDHAKGDQVDEKEETGSSSLDNYTVTYNVVLSIKAPYLMFVPDNASYTYDKKSHSAISEAYDVKSNTSIEGWKIYGVEATSSAQTDVGETDISITFDESKYKVINAAGEDVTDQFKSDETRIKKTGKLTVEAASLSGAQITLGERPVYNSTERTQTVSKVELTVGSEKFEVTSDEYGLLDNVKTDVCQDGDYTLKVVPAEGNGNYKDYCEAKWNITPADINNSEHGTFGFTTNYKHYTGQTHIFIAIAWMQFEGVEYPEFFVYGEGGNCTLGGDITEANAGTYTAQFSAYKNFTGTKNLEWKIDRHPLRVTGFSAQIKQYDGTSAATYYEGTGYILGLVEGEDLNFEATGKCTKEDEASSEEAKDVGRCFVFPNKIELSDKEVGGKKCLATNYILDANSYRESTNSSIVERLVDVGGIKVNEKTYDGNTTSTLKYDDVTFGNIVQGEELGVSATGTFDDKNQGVDKGVHISDMTLSDTETGKASNYRISDASQISAKGTINKKPLNENMVTLSPDTLVYSKKALAPSIVAKDMQGEEDIMNQKTDIATTTIEAKVNKGDYPATIAASETGNYSGSVEKIWHITPAITTATIDFAQNKVIYDGTEKTSGKMTITETTVPKTGFVTTDQVSPGESPTSVSGTNAGTYVVQADVSKFRCIDENVECTFTLGESAESALVIDRRQLVEGNADFKLDGGTEFVIDYDKNEHNLTWDLQATSEAPQAIPKDSDIQIAEGSTQKATNPGQYHVTLEGKDSGNFTGSIKRDWEIQGKLFEIEITGNSGEFDFDGEEKTASGFTSQCTGGLKEEYDPKYLKLKAGIGEKDKITQTNAGEYSSALEAADFVYVDDQGHPREDVRLDVKKLEQVKLLIKKRSFDEVTASLDHSHLEYTSVEQGPNVSVTNTADPSIPVVLDSDCKTSGDLKKTYVNDEGSYKITVSAADNGNYEGSAKILEWYIDPAQVTINVTGHNNISEHATYDGNSHSVSGYDAVDPGEHSFFVASYVQPKEGTKTELAETNAGTFTMGFTPDSFTYSDKNVAPTFVIKQDGTLIIDPKDINSESVTATLSISETTYTGADQTTTIAEIKDVLPCKITTSDYSVDGETTEKNAGTWSVSINGESNYTGTRVIKWTILPANLADGELKRNTTADADETPLVEDGLPKEMKIAKVSTILYPSGKETVTTLEDTDYTVSGNTGTTAGKYTATITGQGNFTGSVPCEWIIAGANYPEAVSDNAKIEIQQSLTTPAVVLKDMSKLDIAKIFASPTELTELSKDDSEAIFTIELDSQDISSSIDPTSKSQLDKAFAAAGHTAGQYVDLSIYKQYSKTKASTDKVVSERQKCTFELSKPVSVSLEVQSSIIGGDNRSYYVYRNHEGNVKDLSGTYDSSSKEMNFESNQFSDYALAYYDKPDEPQPDPGTGGGNSSGGLLAALGGAKTGDTEMVLIILAAFVVAGVCFAGAYALRNKRTGKVTPRHRS